MAHSDQDLSPNTYFSLTCPVVLFIAAMAVTYPDHTATVFTTAAHYIYTLLDLFHFANITKVLLAILFISFVVTTIVCGRITLGILTSNDGENPAKPKIFIWGIFMSAIALPFVLSGRIEEIKAVGSIIGFPYMFCFFMTLAALFKSLRQDKKREEQMSSPPQLKASL